jgi:hypothetical protein
VTKDNGGRGQFELRTEGNRVGLKMINTGTLPPAELGSISEADFRHGNMDV